MLTADYHGKTEHRVGELEPSDQQLNTLPADALYFFSHVFDFHVCISFCSKVIKTFFML